MYAMEEKKVISDSLLVECYSRMERCAYVSCSTFTCTQPFREFRVFRGSF